MIQRAYFETIAKRIDEPRKFIQIIEGPRQVGKSTLIKQVLKGISMPWVHFSAVIPVRSFGIYLWKN
jgi:predicted AAA+ superfamily ATPase